ncbi:MAG: hypothetical protein ACKOWD_15945 [Rhodoferax sp.]
MQNNSRIPAIVATALITLAVAFGLLWVAVEMGWLNLGPAAHAGRDAELDSANLLGKKSSNFVCEVTVSTPQGSLDSPPKVYSDVMVAGLEPESKSGWYQGEYTISESRKGAMHMEGTKAFVSRPAMFERFGKMITQEEFTLDLNDGTFVQTLTFKDGTRRHMLKGVCAKFAKAPFTK